MNYNFNKKISENGYPMQIEIEIDTPYGSLMTYINLLGFHKIPILIEHHMRSMSISTSEYEISGIINYFQDLDWEDLEYIEGKFAK